jgi:hypothetical protein
MTLKVYVPVGREAAERAAAAPALASFKDARLMLLDNGKWNGGKLLRYTSEILRAREPSLELRFERKPFFSRTADPEFISRLIARRPHAVITAIGD